MKIVHATRRPGAGLRSLLLLVAFLTSRLLSAQTTISQSVSAGCPSLTAATATVSMCAGAGAPAVQFVASQAQPTDSLAFVLFTSPQSGTAMYAGGQVLGKVALTNPANQTATLSAGGFPTANQTTAPITYYLYGIIRPATADAACRVSALTTITVQPAVRAVATPQSATLTCIQPFAVLSASNPTGGTTYTWIRPGGSTSAGTSLTVSQPGTYTLTGRLGNCASATAITAVSSDQLPGRVSVNQGMLSCLTPALTLTATISGAYTSVLWTGPNGAAGNGSTLTVYQPGTYRAIVTFANGCVDASNPARVTQSQARPPVILAQGGSMTCTTCSVQLQVETDADNPTFRWRGPNGFSSSIPLPIVSAAGTYTITVKDLDTGCEATDFVVVEAPANDPCPQPYLFTADALTLCAGDHLPDVQVGLDQVSPQQRVAFVLFTSPQSGSSVYTGGTTLATVTPDANLTATLMGQALAPFRNRIHNTQLFYLYALIIPQPATVAGCEPALVTLTMSPGSCPMLLVRRTR